MPPVPGQKIRGHDCPNTVLPNWSHSSKRSTRKITSWNFTIWRWDRYTFWDRIEAWEEFRAGGWDRLKSDFLNNLVTMASKKKHAPDLDNIVEDIKRKLVPFQSDNSWHSTEEPTFVLVAMEPTVSCTTIMPIFWIVNANVIYFGNF
jgi:hypothetical protein